MSAGHPHPRFYRAMTHGFSSTCLFVCLFVGHKFLRLMSNLSETHKAERETLVMDKARLIFPA